MKTKTLVLALCMLMLFAGCSKEDEKGDFKVSGMLESEGKPLESVLVNIDGLEQFKSTTNSEGYFSIENVPAGSHSLNTKKSGTDNSFIQKSYTIELLNSDLMFESLILPNPVLIDTILLDGVSNIATIIWNTSLADDFREYKLYSHSTSGLDETTGQLEHVSIDRRDTSKSIQLENLSERYFRVFVLNEFGQLGGSNIKSVSSLNRNLILGGNFENLNDLSYWNLSGIITIDNTSSYAGLGSVLLSSVIDSTAKTISGTKVWWSVSENDMSINIDLNKNRDYTISFWYRLFGFGYMMYPLNFYYDQNNEEKIYTTIYDYDWAGVWVPSSPFKILDDTGWLYFTKTFNSDSESNAVFHIKTQVEKVWIDNLEIKIVE